MAGRGAREPAAPVARTGAPRRTLAAAALVVAVATSCGGTSRLSKSEYLERANRVCGDAVRAVDRISPPDPADGAAVGRAGQRVVAVERGALVALRRLRPPKSDEERLERWIALVDQTLDQAEASVAAQRRGDLAAANAANDRGALVDARADELAAGYGLDRCVGTDGSGVGATSSLSAGPSPQG